MRGLRWVVALWAGIVPALKEGDSRELIRDDEKVEKLPAGATMNWSYLPWPWQVRAIYHIYQQPTYHILVYPIFDTFCNRQSSTASDRDADAIGVVCHKTFHTIASEHCTRLPTVLRQLYDTETSTFGDVCFHAGLVCGAVLPAGTKDVFPADLPSPDLQKVPCGDNYQKLWRCQWR